MKIPDFVTTHLPEPAELNQVSNHVFSLENNLEEHRKNSRENAHKIVIISGLSGSGKDTIMDKLMGDGKKYKRVRTCTTRQRRPEESDVDDPHIRITTDELHQMLIDGTALECVEYAGNYYCTSKFEIKKIIDEGKTPLLRVDPQGANFFLNARKNGHNFLKDFDFSYIFIVPTSFQDLRERLVRRGSSPTLVDERIEQSRKDITHIGESHYIVINEYGVLEEVVEEVLRLLK